MAGDLPVSCWSRPPSGAQLIWTVHLLRVLVPTAAPGAVLARTMLTGWAGGQTGPVPLAFSLRRSQSVPLAWTVPWIQVSPRGVTFSLGRESSMSDLGQREALRGCTWDGLWGGPLSHARGSERAPPARHSLGPGRGAPGLHLKAWRRRDWRSVDCSAFVLSPGIF